MALVWFLIAKVKFLYLPIEITNRELDAKILVALQAARNGFTVFLGSMEVLKLAEAVGSGVVLYKDSSAPMARVFERLRERNVRVAVHDEEGFVHRDDDAYVSTRLRFDTIKFVDLFCAWGSRQARMVEGVAHEYSSGVKVVSTGHPRIDLLRFLGLDEGFSESVSVGGNSNYILINTKLAECNHRQGVDGWLNILDAHSMIRSEDERCMRLRQIEYKRRLLENYKRLISRLSCEFPELKIVIRPHPAEDKSFWIEYSSAFSNVCVDWSGSIGEWISRARVVVHTGCTTGLEAAVAGRPVVAYKPIRDKEFEIDLPDSVSAFAGSDDDVVSFVRAGGAGGSVMVKQKLAEFVTGLDGGYAFERIVDEFGQLSIDEGVVLDSKVRMARWALLARDLARRMFRRGEKESIDPKFYISKNLLEQRLSLFLPVGFGGKEVAKISRFSDRVYVFSPISDSK